VTRSYVRARGAQLNREEARARLASSMYFNRNLDLEFK